MKKKVYYHDTDAGGVVYYANYLKYFEEARSEFFSQRGLDLKKCASEGTLFVVAYQEADYKHPAFYADVLDVSVKITHLSGVRIEFMHEVINQEARLITKAKATLVCVGKDLKPKPIPEEILTRLT